jgi:hypothetical protein
MCRLLFEGKLITDWTSRKPSNVLLPIAKRSSVRVYVCTCVRVYVSAQHMDCQVLCDVILQKPYFKSLKRVRRLFFEMPHILDMLHSRSYVWLQQKPITG